MGVVAAPEHDPHATRRRRPFKAGGPHSTRILLLCTAAAAALAAAAAAQSSTARLESPRSSEIARGPSAIRDARLSARAQLPPYWGGELTASTGERVTIYVSRSYPEDPATAQRWADFLAGLVHGSELSSLVALLATPGEVTSVCGAGALACYSPAQQLLVAPGDDPSPSISAEAVVTHEYGHHVAANRSNAPWAAIDYGTKRWASYEQVCAQTGAGQLFPGAETIPQYALNPGEAFAETFRVLNERKAGTAEAPWDVVSQSLYPDDTALALVEQDVTSPWRAATTSARSGGLTKTAHVRSYTVATPLDGALRVTLRPPAKALETLAVYSGTARLARATASRAVSVSTTVCGQRSLEIRVSRVAGAGTFRLAIATP